MFWPIFLTILILLVTWLRWRQKNRRLLDMAKKFPGPKALPFLGNAWLFMCKPEDQMDTIKDLITEYGEVVRFWLGPDLNFVISNPEDVKVLLTNPKTSYKGPQYKYMAEFLGGGILSGSGPTWKLHRKLAASNYSTQAVESYSDVFNTEMDELLQDFKLMPKGRMFNIYNSVVKATTYSVCQALMGLSKDQTMALPNLQMVIEESAKLYDILFSRMTKWYLQIDPVFWLTDLYSQQKMGIKLSKDFCKAIIKYRASAKGGLYNIDTKNGIGNTETSIVDKFLASKVMNEDSLWQETMTIFTSSQEAGAKITSFLLLMMAYHPECQEKLYAEIETVMSDDERWVSGDHIKQMPYLDMVFKEVTRLFPTGAIIQRCIQEDIEISSGTLPAGSSLAFPIYHLQRDPRFWTNPDAFDPERFSPENSKTRNPNCFIPFSLGPMDCLGRHFGAKLVKTIAVRILREYKLTSLNCYKHLKVYIAISAKSLNGYDVILNPRN